MLIVRNARVATMLGPQAAHGDAPLGLIEDGAVAIEDGGVSYVRPCAGAPTGPALDAGGALVTPGLVEPHTHLLFGGDRAGEHAARLAGKSYLDLARAGGGTLRYV